MIPIAIVAVVIILIFCLFGPVLTCAAAVCGLLVSEKEGGRPARTANALVSYTLGEFKTLGGFTTLGESVCRAAIYLQTAAKYGRSLLLMPHTGDDVAWLNYKGVSLELDGLDEANKLAFEYDGPQHYSWAEWCKMGRRAQKSDHVLDFYRARFYDRIKTQMCQERGIHLIRVSTWTSFDSMRNVIAYALDHDYSESRPVEDALVINALHEIDTNDSSFYPQLEWGEHILVLPTKGWQPHPYESSGIYPKMFMDEIHRFADEVREGLLSMLPVGTPHNREEIYHGIMTHFDRQLAIIQNTVDPSQFMDVHDALDDVASSVALQLCV